MRCPPLRIDVPPVRLVPVCPYLQGMLQSEGSSRTGGSLKFEATPVFWLVLPRVVSEERGKQLPKMCVCTSKGE